ncbi:hypothetical protein NDU88_003489, partial [Pleurodeles waltl]
MQSRQSKSDPSPTGPRGSSGTGSHEEPVGQGAYAGIRILTISSACNNGQKLSCAPKGSAWDVEAAVQAFWDAGEFHGSTIHMERSG